MYNKGPFANWVPKPLMLLLMLLILFPIMVVSGVYTSIMSDISGSMATFSEYISLANNAGTIGMGTAIFIVLRIKMRFKSKEIITVSAILLAILSYMCGTTDDPWLLVSCSFLIGFIKMFPMIDVILPFMFILSPTGEKGKFYAVFYTVLLISSQIVSYYAAIWVLNGNWQSPYMIMSGVMLFVTLLSLIFQHNQRFCFKMPLYQVDWLSLVLFSASFMCFNYSFVFMKQQGWFISPFINGTLLGGILLFMLLIFRQNFIKRKLIYFEIFKRKDVIHGTILLLFFGIYMASSSIYLQYAVGVLGYNSLVNAGTSLWVVPGIALAGILAFFGFENKWKIRYFIASGFVAFALHTLILYFVIQPQMDIRYLEYAMLLKGLGIGILFIGIWFYLTLNLSMDQLMGLMGILIAFRSFLATAIGSAVLGWATYQSQWQSLSDMSNHLDTGLIPNGMAIYKEVSLNAIMASEKIILGSLVWLLLPILLFVLTHSYGKFNFRRMVLLRKRIRGNTVKGYKLS